MVGRFWLGRLWTRGRLAISRSLPARRLAPSARSVAWTLSFILLSAPQHARADGCNFGDVVQAIENTVSSISSGACGEACAEGGAGCIAAAGVAAGLGGVAASQGQSSVDNFCSQLNTGVSDVGSITSWLDAAGLGADVVNAIAGLGLGPLVSAG